MAVDGRELIAAFRTVAEAAGLGGKGIMHEQQLAPHQPHKLPAGKGAVYVFSLSKAWGEQCGACPGCVLKVGKVGPNSNARFESQHYNAGSAPSTLAARLLQHPEVWQALGLSDPTRRSINTWLRARIDRNNFYVAGEEDGLRSLFESFLIARLQPVFEG